MWKYTPFLLLALSGCATSPRSLAENHLSLLKAGKASEATAQYCSKTDTLRLHTITSYEIKSSDEKSSDEGSYTEVKAAIASPQTKLVELKSVPIDSVELQIWDSEDFYNFAVKSSAQLSELGKRTSTLTGEAVAPIAAPVRTDYSSEKQCVFLPFDQFADQP